MKVVMNVVITSMMKLDAMDNTITRTLSSMEF